MTMYEATLVHVVKSVEVNSVNQYGDSVEELLERIETSASARGIEITKFKNIQGNAGDILKNGEIVGYWNIAEVSVVEGELVS
ncbi:hypothetical protein SEA_NEDARYA_91 [Gordonia phage Nedarya]|nr:hypothetical protein SEA_NEDARYA_91 [Gordonia phage Nedarya]